MPTIKPRKTGSWGKYPTVKEQKKLEKEKVLYKSTLEIENQKLTHALGRANAQIEDLRRMVRDLTYSYGEKKGVRAIRIEFDNKHVEEERL